MAIMFGVACFAAACFVGGCAQFKKPYPENDLGRDTQATGNPWHNIEGAGNLGAEAEWDALASRAAQSALLGQGVALDSLTAEAKSREKAAARAGQPHPAIARRIALLRPLAAAPPLPYWKDAKKAAIEGGGGGTLHAQIRATLAEIRAVEPRSKLKQAQTDHLYAVIQGPLNSTTAAVVRVMQGELFALVEWLDDAAESLVRRPYPSPSEREMLRAARDLLAAPSIMDKPENLQKRVDRGLLARRRLARLQAVETAKIEERRGNPERALWWISRARLLDPESAAVERALEKAAASVNRTAFLRRNSLAVLDSESAMTGERERVLYALLVAAMAENPAGAETARLREEFLVECPYSAAAPAARFTEIASLAASGKPDAARAVAEWQAAHLAREEGGGRAALLAASGQFSSRADYASALARQRVEWWAYLFLGKKPDRAQAHLAAEDARRIPARWLDFLRPVFVVDVANRLILLPFGWPLDHGPALDAIGRWTPPAPDDNAAAAQKLERAKALWADKRFEEAAAAFRELDPPDELRARRAIEKAAALRLREARALADAREQAAALEELLSDFPATPSARKAEALLEKARAQARTLATWTPKDLRASPWLCGPEYLGIAPEWIDGSKDNGEISKQGVSLCADNRICFADAASGESRETPLAPGPFARLRALADEMNRAKRTQNALSAPGRHPRIPLQIEGNVAPGVEAAPGLVPPRENASDVLFH